jgi:hypothetical protein
MVALMDIPSRLALAIECYRVLLKIPVDSMLRTEAQKALACCRDAIADEAGMKPEEVQIMWEKMVPPSFLNAFETKRVSDQG